MVDEMPETNKEEIEKANVIETYDIKSESIKIEVNIVDDEKVFVRLYYLNFPSYGPGTVALLNNLRATILSETSVRAERTGSAKFILKTKNSLVNILKVI